MVDLKNKHSPCAMCYQKGIRYSPISGRCVSCEYNIAVKLLVKALKEYGYCWSCKKRKSLNGVWSCPLADNQSFKCHNGEQYEIDLEAACAGFGIETL